MSKTAETPQLSFLFLGGAKRLAMGRLLAKACAARGLVCRIVGYELSRFCPLAAMADVVEGLRWSDPLIFDSLDRVVRDHNVDVVIPFVDPAVALAARFTAQGVRDRNLFSPVSKADLSTIMFDKSAAAELFEKLGLPIPRTYRAGDPAVGLIAKPRLGSASKGIVEVDDANTLAQLSTNTYLIQERIDHRSEITVDCYVGVHDGRIYAVSPRERLEVSGGEAVKTATIDDPEAVALTRRVLESTGLRGAVTVQLIRDIDSGRLLLMEINPRLGGGAVASVHAGADIPGLIIADALGEKLSEQFATPGVVVARYLDDVVFYPEKE